MNYGFGFPYTDHLGDLHSPTTSYVKGTGTYGRCCCGHDLGLVPNVAPRSARRPIAARFNGHVSALILAAHNARNA